MKEEGRKARDLLAPTPELAQVLPSGSIARVTHWLGGEAGVAVGRGTWTYSPAPGGEDGIPGPWGLG